MEDYIRGIVCGYLTVQSGTQADAKRRRLFVVLSDSRMDYYFKDPRPEFKEKVDEAYAFKPQTKVHHYVELNTNAPPNSFCLITDKRTDVFIAESTNDESVWFANIKERLEMLSSMLTGTLLIRKELGLKQQFQRLVLHSKYTWMNRYFELGRSIVRFSKDGSEKRTKAMKQFALAADSVVSEEAPMRLLPVAFSGISTAEAVDSQTLKQHARKQRERERQGKGAKPEDSDDDHLIYPFILCTGQAHLVLATSSEKTRDDWVLAIRLRIVQLKYHHSKSQNGGAKTQLHGFMDAQFKAAGEWKKHYVELENDLLKVKTNERKLGSKFETALLPTCQITLSPMKANAFVVRNMSKEIWLAPSTPLEYDRWVKSIQHAAVSVSAERCQKVFEHETHELLQNSAFLTIEVEPGMYAGLVVEKNNKHCFVLSHHHEPESKGAAQADASKKKAPKAKGKNGGAPVVADVPRGSVLVGISEFGFIYESFENIWHRLTRKKGHQHHMTLTFRAPYRKRGVVQAKSKTKDKWAVRYMAIEDGRLRVETTDEGAPIRVHDFPLRVCTAELLGVDVCSLPNCMRIQIDAHHHHEQVYVHVPLDEDFYLWYVLLLLETSIAKGDPRFPIALPSTKELEKTTFEELTQRYRKCKVLGKTVAEIEKSSESTTRNLLENGPIETFARSPSLRTLDLAVQTEMVQLKDLYPPLLHTEVHTLFLMFDVLGCDRVSSAAVVPTIEALVRHVGPPEEVLEAFHDSLRKLLEAAGKDYVVMNNDQFLQVMQNITEPQALKVLRKYCHGDIKCM